MVCSFNDKFMLSLIEPRPYRAETSHIYLLDIFHTLLKRDIIYP